jgi:hypothetical protein
MGPPFKLYIVPTLVLLISSCYVLGTIYVFSLAFYTYSLYVSVNKVRVVPVHTINAYGSGGITPPILNISTIFPRHFTHRRKSPWSTLDRLLSEPGWMLWRRERLVFPLRIEPQFLDSVACSLATTLSYPAPDCSERSHCM